MSKKKYFDIFKLEEGGVVHLGDNNPGKFHGCWGKDNAKEAYLFESFHLLEYITRYLWRFGVGRLKPTIY